jgi:hypothetical protein
VATTATGDEGLAEAVEPAEKSQLKTTSELVKKAVDAYLADRVDSPAGANALEYISQVMEIDSENEAARNLLIKIFARYVGEGMDAVEASNGEQVVLSHEKAQRLRAGFNLSESEVPHRIRQRADSLEKEYNVMHLISKASLAFESGHIDEPEEDNSLYYISEIKALAPDSERVAGLLDGILAHYLETGREALGDSKISEAESNYSKAQELSAANDLPSDGVLDLKKRIDQKKRNKKQSDRILRLLKKVETAFAAGKVDSPEGDCVLDYIAQIKKLSPRYGGLEILRQKVIRHYLIAAEARLDSGELGPSRSYYEKARQIAVENKMEMDDLNLFFEKIETAEKQEKANELLARARELFETGKIEAPEDENAVSCIAGAMELSPGNEDAEKLMVDIIDAYVALGRGELDDGDIESAQKLEEKATRIQMMCSVGENNLEDFRGEIEYAVTKKEKREKNRVWGTF